MRVFHVLILPLVVLTGFSSRTAVAQTSQATDLSVAHRFGQTFLTWTEATATPVPDAYHVYRSVTPIRVTADLARATLVAKVPKGSYLNKRANLPLRLLDLGTPLDPTQGVHVATAAENRAWYWAVLAVRGMTEDRSVTVGANGNASGAVRDTIAAPRPILQSIKDLKDHHYIHFAPGVTTSAVDAQSNVDGGVFNFRLHVDKLKAGPRPVILSLHQRGGNYKGLLFDFAPDNAIQLLLDDPEDRLSATTGATVWFGYHEDLGTSMPTGTVVPYTERRVLWTLDWVKDNLTLTADENRVYAIGASYGGMGALGLGFRYPDVFAAVAGLVPAFGLTHSDLATFLRGDFNKLFGTETQNLDTSLGEKVYDLFDYRGQLAKKVVSSISPMMFVVGRADTITGWTEKPAFFRASYANRQPASFFWDRRDHFGLVGTDWDQTAVKMFGEMLEIRLDRPVPAFSNLTLDDNPGNGSRLDGDLTGTMGGYVRFDPTSVTETATKVSMDIGLKDDSMRLDHAKSERARVDLTFRRLSKFPVTPDTYYRIRTRTKGTTTILEERIVTPDANGLLTVRGLSVVRSNMRTLELEVYPAVLPEVHFGGDTERSGTLALSLLAKKNEFVMFTIGGQEGSITTPFGVWRILDPIFVYGGVSPPNGHFENLIPLPSGPRLSGGRILGQAMVGFSITPLARIRFR